MTKIKLTKRETALLTEASGRGDRVLTLPSGIKEASARKLIDRLLGLGLIVPCEDNGVPVHCLAPAGYRAVGVAPPISLMRGGTEPGATKRDMVIGLLGRDEGASVDELMAATGWLAHTTRAALSRLRSSGRDLSKNTREDGRTAYRIGTVGQASQQPAAIFG